MRKHTVEFLTPEGSPHFSNKELEEALEVTKDNIRLRKQLKVKAESPHHEIQLVENEAGDEFIIVNKEDGDIIVYNPRE